jgi:predicted outer membrane repeat protein
MIKNKNKTSLIRLLILTTILIATVSMISESTALSVNLQPGQSIKSITELALGFDNVAELNLAPGTYNNTNDQNINTGTGNVTIRGTNASQKSIIDLQGLNRFFTVNNVSTLKLENLVIQNCKAPSNNGGVIILNGGELIINNCEFINNTAHMGGAIIAYPNSKIAINNSIFRDHYVTNGGGVIHIAGDYFDQRISLVNIMNSKFFNNRANNGGGAILGGGLTLSNCDFYNNSAMYGGAVNGEGIINDCMFYNNTAMVGGAWSGGDVVISNSYFIANKAEFGGALYGINGNISFSKFYDNIATGTYSLGGAIFLSTSSVANIVYCDFIGNRANVNGGAIFTYNLNGLTSILNFFLNNFAPGGNDIGY